MVHWVDWLGSSQGEFQLCSLSLSLSLFSFFLFWPFDALVYNPCTSCAFLIDIVNILLLAYQ